MIHALKDAKLIAQVALAAAGASVSTEAFNLTQGPPHEPHFEVELSIPALADLADDKSVTATLEDSEDGENFAAIAALAQFEVTGAGGNGSDAATLRVRLPSDTRQYVRATVATEAAAGDLTASKFTMALVF